jgi:dipeptidase E
MRQWYNEGMKKLLLTSQMIHNTSIAGSLSKLLGKPFSEAKIAYIITSHNGATGEKSWFVENINSLYNLGWKTFYMIDVAGKDGLPKESWMAQLEEADVIAMGGGANFYLSYWVEKSGLLEQLPRLLETKVYVGASAGSMLVQPNFSTSSDALREYSHGNWDIDLSLLGPKGRSSTRTLQLIDFLIRPHYYSKPSDFINDKLLREVGTHFKLPIYALDDDSAVEIIGDQVSVVSEGKWKHFDI